MMESFTLKFDSSLKDNEQENTFKDLDKSKLEILDDKTKFHEITPENIILNKKDYLWPSKSEKFEFIDSHEMNIDKLQGNNSKIKHDFNELLIKSKLDELVDNTWNDSMKLTKPSMANSLHKIWKSYTPDVDEVQAPGVEFIKCLSDRSKISVNCDYRFSQGSNKKTNQLSDDTTPLMNKQSSEIVLTSKQSVNSLGRVKLKKRKDEKRFKLTGKKSVLSKISDFTDISKIKRKKKLQRVSSKRTLNINNSVSDGKNIQTIKKSKNNNYIYPDASPQMKKENITKIDSPIKKSKYIEIDSDEVKQENLTQSLRNDGENAVIDKANYAKKINTEIQTETPVKAKEESNKEKSINKGSVNHKEVTNESRKQNNNESNLQSEQKLVINNESSLFKKEVKNDKEKVKQIIDLQCPRIPEENEFDKTSNFFTKNDLISYNDSMVMKNYEHPTEASKLKQADLTYYKRFRFKYIPFIAGTSVTPSYNIGLNFQNTLGMMKNKQLKISCRDKLLFRKISRGTKPIISLLTENIQDENYHNKEPQNTDTLDETSNLSSKISFLKSKSWKSLSPRLKSNSCVLDPSEKLSLEINQLLQDGNTLGTGNFRTRSKTTYEIRNIFIKLHDEFAEMNEKYEKLLEQSEKSNSATLKQDLTEMEKSLNSKEEEINVFAFLYQEVKNLKQQLKQLNEHHDFFRINEFETYSGINKNNYKYRSQPSLRMCNVRLLALLKSFQSKQNQS